jgi:hypothetical protein
MEFPREILVKQSEDEMYLFPEPLHPELIRRYASAIEAQIEFALYHLGIPTKEKS